MGLSANVLYRTRYLDEIHEANPHWFTNQVDSFVTNYRNNQFSRISAHEKDPINSGVRDRTTSG